MNRYMLVLAVVLGCLWGEAQAQTCSDPVPNQQVTKSTRWWQVVTVCDLGNGETSTNTRTLPYMKNGCVINGVPYHCWFNSTTKEVRLVIQRYP